jgi:hypothetical protein
MDREPRADPKVLNEFSRIVSENQKLTDKIGDLESKLEIYKSDDRSAEIFQEISALKFGEVRWTPSVGQG